MPPAHDTETAWEYHIAAGVKEPPPGTDGFDAWARTAVDLGVDAWAGDSDDPFAADYPYW